MSGTAFRTNAIAHRADRPMDPSAAVCVLYPPLLDSEGVQTHVIVAATVAGDTVVLACDETGLMLSRHAIGSVPGSSHAKALRAVGFGYELEVITPCPRSK